MEAGVIFKGRQILVPPSMQKDILKQLHSGHQGVEKTRRLARESVYWVKMNSDIENTCKSCESCQEQPDANRREPLLPHCLPARPWQCIATDLFQILDRHYLLTVDRYNKYPLVDDIAVPITSRSVADKLSQYCSMFGRPDQISTDNGPQYTGQAFKTFTETWGITHVTSYPHYARSNGLAERYVRYIKGTLKKSSDMKLALLNTRATPVDAKLPSPAEMLMGRPLTTLLPSSSEPGTEKHRYRMQERQTAMKDQHNKSSRKEDLSSRYTGQAVRILHHQRKTWCPGKIVSKCNEPRSYVVETSNGTRLRRNRAHLRELVASPAKTVRFSDEPARPTRFSDEPARPTQIVQQNVSDQPDTVDEADSQSGKEETTHLRKYACVNAASPSWTPSWITQNAQ